MRLELVNNESYVMCNSAGWCDICYIIASKAGGGGGGWGWGWGI